MVSVFDLFERNPNVLWDQPKGFDVWQQVNDQASRHTQRSEFSDLYDTSRPLEEEIFREWRNSNKRNVTVGQVDRYISTMYKVLRYSSVSLDDIKGLDDEFLDVLNDNPFVVNGQRVSLDKLRYDCNIQASLEDPNAALVEYPYDPEKPLEPLFENFDANKKFRVDTLYIPYYRIKYSPDDEAEVFIWHSHDILISYFDDEDEEHTTTQKVYMCVDTEAYYWAIPYYGEHNEIEYRLELHLTHDIGRVPIAHLPRRIKSVTTYADNNTGSHYEKTRVKYGETFIFGALPYFDEAVVRLSQDQVNFARHINPRFWMRGSADCPECNGAKKVIYRKAGFGSTMDEMPCQTCNGTGDMPADMGQFSTYRLADNSHPSDKQVSGVPMGYVDAPTGILDLSDRSWKEWLKMGVDALMVDPVDGTANESGEAKKMRLLGKEDLIKEYGDLEIDTITAVLNNKYDILFIDQEEEIVIPKPLNYNVKNADTLKEEYEAAPQPVKHSKFLSWKAAEYRGNETKVKAFELASLYAPLMHYDDAELRTAIGSTYEPIDVIRRDYALIIFEELLDGVSIDAARDISVKEWREKADQWLIDAGIVGLDEAAPDASTVDDHQDEPLDPNAPPTGGTSVSPDQELDAIFQAFFDGKIDRETLIENLVDQTGSSAEEISAVLQEKGI